MSQAPEGHGDHDCGPHLLGLACAEAPHPVAQQEILTALRPHFSAAPFDVGHLESVFTSGGVERRTLALPLEDYFELHGSAARHRAFARVADDLLDQVVEKVLPERVAADVTHVVTVCSSGLATPTLECGLMTRRGISLAARRAPVFGLGCAGGVAGLQLARDLARSGRDALVLLLVVELTSLTWLAGDLSRRNFVACSLFGDGAAAALVGRPGGGLEPLARLGGGVTHLFQGTRDLMGWDFRDDGWGVVFSRRIPALVRREVEGLIRPLVPRSGFTRFALHPGGRKILEAYTDALGLGEEDLAAPREVLRRHGNMSAATVPFVLSRLLPLPGTDVREEILTTAFGPGFTAEAMTLTTGGSSP